MVDVTNPVNWTIKNISEEAKNHALARAKTADIPVGLWLEKLLAADRDGPGQVPIVFAARVDLRQLTEIMRAAADIMAATGRPIPKRAASHAYALLSQELRQARQMTASMPAVSGTASGARAISGPPAKGSTPAIASSES